eukprot:1840893-Amphidinium_carterae.1
MTDSTRCCSGAKLCTLCEDVLIVLLSVVLLSEAVSRQQVVGFVLQAPPFTQPPPRPTAFLIL